MKRRDSRRKREREALPEALVALLNTVPENCDPRKYLMETFGSQKIADDAIIEGDGLSRLLEELNDACPNGVADIIRITKRVPRSQSTEEQIQIAELCFAISQAREPISAHERRRAVSSTEPVDESSPLFQYYKGHRFAGMIHGKDYSSPAARLTSEVEADSLLQEEWEKFVTTMGKALPMSIRLHRNERVLQREALRMLSTDAEVKTQVCPVASYPQSLGMYSCSNDVYHANEHVKMVCRSLHAANSMSFQEVVSALPVMVLNPQPHHSVFDMCAAPGSKTLQALDSMLEDGWSAAVSRGVLVANEKDRVKATQTLPARLKRYHAPNILCTRCDGTQWPRMYTSQTVPSTEEELASCSPSEMQFDRIICDVPCSGDGTFRKERSVATTWSAGYVKSLVPTQKALLRRGLDLLATDGVLVYSTCSLNPKENEEVVCAGLELFGDSVELLNVNDALKERGVVLHSQGGIDSPNADGLHQNLLPSSYRGSHVLRVFPHRDDTGGFFVAAFRKVKQPDWTSARVLRRNLNQWTKGKLWAPVTTDDPNWVSIASFYGFDRTKFVYHPSSSAKNETDTSSLVPVYHLNPHGNPSRRIMLLTPALAHLLFSVRPYKGPGVEVVTVGVRAFERYDGSYLANATCRWRAVVEAASFLSPMMSSRKLVLRTESDQELLISLLRDGFVYLSEHWPAILRPQPEVSTPLIKPGPLATLLTLERLSDEQRQSGAQMLGTEVDVGGVVVLVKRSNNEDAWCVSATLSASKLELAIDASLRAFGLMSFFGRMDLSTGAEEARMAERQSE